VVALFVLALLNVSCFALAVMIWKAGRAGDKERQKTLIFLFASALVLSTGGDWYLIAGLIALSHI
jgi:hypothetical protein